MCIRDRFFTDVEVPVGNIVGEINDGWRVAMTTLTHERSSNLNTAAHFQEMLSKVLAQLSDEQRRDPRIRLEVGRLHEEIEAYRYMTLRTLSELAIGRSPSAQSYMGLSLIHI